MTLGRKRAFPCGREAIRKISEPPEWMHETAKAEWRRAVPILFRRRVLTPADMLMVEHFCCAAGLSIRARQEAEQLPSVYVTAKNGVMRQHPAVAVARQSANDARRLAGELGLTPASRHLRGGAPPAQINEPEQEDDTADDFADVDLGDDTAPGSARPR